MLTSVTRTRRKKTLSFTRSCAAVCSPSRASERGDPPGLWRTSPLPASCRSGSFRPAWCGRSSSPPPPRDWARSPRGFSPPPGCSRSSRPAPRGSCSPQLSLQAKLLPQQVKTLSSARAHLLLKAGGPAELVRSGAALRHLLVQSVQSARSAASETTGSD